MIKVTVETLKGKKYEYLFHTPAEVSAFTAGARLIDSFGKDKMLWASAEPVKKKKNKKSQP